jgi:hypothetical protein
MVRPSGEDEPGLKAYCGSGTAAAFIPAFSFVSIGEAAAPAAAGSSAERFLSITGEQPARQQASAKAPACMGRLGNEDGDIDVVGLLDRGVKRFLGLDFSRAQAIALGWHKAAVEVIGGEASR